ncbi:MAG: ribonuclease III [Clostridiales Family XIII bacterium]|nr:ribonuclease III [Clostridiales Family XIII bacterium]
MNKAALIEKTGYRFKDVSLLETALNHTSYVNENNLSKFNSNERLEFLGDAVLEWLISEELYRRLPDVEEGALTRLRAYIVCEASLFRVAGDFSLGDFLNLGKGEENCGGRGRPSVVSDALEALIGAIYLDGGAEAARRFVARAFADAMEDAASGATAVDYKSDLQERLQVGGQVDIRYLVDSQEGPDHDTLFHISVFRNGERIGRGSGRSKKQAEQAAAKNALERTPRRNAP